MSGQILFSHPTGNANVRAALTAFLEAGLLGEFHTTIATYPNSLWEKLSNHRWGADFRRRKFDYRLESKTVQHPFRELGRIGAGKMKLQFLTKHETGFFSVDATYRGVDSIVARRLRQRPDNFSSVYAYEDGGLETFRAARELGIRRFYDLPIAYWECAQILLKEEASRLPKWEPTLVGTRDSSEKLARKEEELALSTKVICPSQFVADSLPAGTRNRAVIGHFGSPAVTSAANTQKSGAGKLRVLFAGSMTQRKGLGDLFAATRNLSSREVELVVVGTPLVPMEFYRNEFSGFTYETVRPHDQLLELMKSCDVFCLPSIVEGRALVLQEAMSQGLPLIITPNTGGEDLIEEGVTGFLVPIRSPEAIAEKIGWCVENRDQLKKMSLAAQAKSQTYTWKAYGQILVETVSAIIE